MLTVFRIKGQVLHRAREHLKEPGCSSVFNELLLLLNYAWTACILGLLSNCFSSSSQSSCSAPARETQVELKTNHGNQGFENLFALYPIWSNICIVN